MDKDTKSTLASNMANRINLNSFDNTVELIMREGAAPRVQEPVKVYLKGTIDAPAIWTEARANKINQEASYVIFSREEMFIGLRCDENDPLGTAIEGKLQLAEEFQKFEINTGNYKTNFELAELIKMNRVYFENRNQAMKLVTELQNFKAKVDKEIEQSNNNRGDRRILLNQIVQHNLPESFNLCLPIFKGRPKQTIQVEVYVNPADLTCTLVSPEANDFMQTARDGIMDAVLSRIKDAAPEIVIIEV